MPLAPDGIVLPKCAGGDDIVKLGKLLDTLEIEHGLPLGRTRVLPIVTEKQPAALFRLHEYAASAERLRRPHLGR